MRHLKFTHAWRCLPLATALAAWLFAAGCSEDHELSPNPGDATTEIIPQASIATVTVDGADAASTPQADTRASIEGDAFPVSTEKIYVVTAYAGTTAPSSNWSGAYFDAYYIQSDASGKHTFTNNPKGYYPSDASKKLYFYAYAPFSLGGYANGTASSQPIVSWNITGQEDIMWASYLTGIARATSGTTQPQPQFQFQHKLKQVRFKIKADPSFDTGVKVTSLKVVNTYNFCQMILGEGSLGYSGSTSLSLPITSGTKDEITTAGTEMDGCIMFAPGIAFKLEMTTSTGAVYKDIAVKLSGTDAGQAGKSHLVTLTFKPGTVTVSQAITVNDWTYTGSFYPTTTYPYLVSNKYVVSKDTNGASAGPFHPQWPGATPVHDELSPLNAIAPVLEVARQACSVSNAPGVPLGENGMYTWENAIHACAAYNLEGGATWRLPTVNEMLAISGVGGIGASSNYYWSASESASSPANAVLVNLQTGAKAFELKTTALGYARCVRDASLPSTSTSASYPHVEENKYIVSDPAKGSYGGVPFHGPWGTGTPNHAQGGVLNSVSSKFEVASEDCTQANTGVGSSGNQFSWDQAKQACTAYKAAEGGWRLPTARELELVFKLKPSGFDPQAELYWTGTRYSSTTSEEICVISAQEGLYDMHFNSSLSVRCVRDIFAAVGDYYYTDGSFSTTLNAGKTVAGVVMGVNAADRNNFKIVSLDEPDANLNGGTNAKGILPWSTETVSRGATYDYEGWQNVDKIKVVSGWQAKYPAIAYCDSKTTGGSGWYLPARYELRDLYASYNTYGKSTFNTRLTTAGGTAFTADNYWTSTEYRNTDTWRVHFGVGFQGYTTGKEGGHYVRCIKEINP